MNRARVRVTDNLGYIKKHPKWFCSNPNNFQFVTDAEQLLTKCFPRECQLLHEFDKLEEYTKRTYLKLLRAKKNGFWICQEKTITPLPQEEEKRGISQDSPDFSRSSGQRSKTRCSICFAEIEVPRNQLLVFCPTCDTPFTNELALVEED